MTPTKPDYDLSVKRRSREDKASTRAGAAWINDDGSISVVINPCVVLTDNKDYIIRLFPSKNFNKSDPSDGQDDEHPLDHLAQK